jgi:hypothetical protein
VHSVPQPAAFFRKRLLERFGYLDESYHFIFDFELFWRFARAAKIKKIERTLAFYRIHTASKTSDWNKFLVELYRFSRPLWPRLGSAAFARTVRSFVSAYLARRFGAPPRDWRFWTAATVVGALAATGIGNPEALSFGSFLSSAPPRPRRVEPARMGVRGAADANVSAHDPRGSDDPELPAAGSKP